MDVKGLVQRKLTTTFVTTIVTSISLVFLFMSDRMNSEYPI